MKLLPIFRCSKFMVVDLTSTKKSGARGGVYFEAGFARGLGLEVIFTCEKKSLKNIHFDVNGNNILLWERNELGVFERKLKNRIESTLGRGRN